jgi:colanic acid biosynthesis glycosyl transferase WcaI
MRILILGINFFPEQTGIGKYTGEMGAYLASKGHHVRVVTAPPYYPHWSVQRPYNAWRYQRETWQGVQVYRCPLWVPKNISGIKRILHLGSFALSSLPIVLMQLPWRPQLVICVAPALSSAPVALLLARACGAAAWLHIQDFEVDAALNLGMLESAGGKARILRGLERLLLRAFDRVSSISGRMCARLRDKGVMPERIVLFPNWVDTQAICPTEQGVNPYRQVLGLKDTDRVLLYSGNMGQKQGLDILLETARLLQPRRDISFVLCGDGVERPRIVAQAEGLANVRFLPVQPVEKLNSLLNLAAIHLLPQRADAADLVMPSKLTGMLASGRPVIATASPGTEIAEVLDGRGIVTPPGDARSLANCISELLDSPEEMARLGQAARQFAVAMLDKNAVLSRFALWLESGENNRL